MNMELINTLQSDILTELSRYQFLTVSQFQILTGKSAGYLREMLGSLSRRGYIKSFRIEVSYKVRSENMYFLLPLAAEFLMSHKNAFPDTVNLPVSANPVVVKDYFHRYSFVNLHLSLVRYLEAQAIPLVCFYSYLNKTGSMKRGNLVAKTRVPLEGEGFYIPDGVMRTEKALYLLEQYCDRDTKRILTQLGTHAKAIALGTPGKTFDIAANPFILSAFSHDGIKNAVIKRLQQNEKFAPMAHLFFFATLDEVMKDTGNAWYTITGERLVFT